MADEAELTDWEQELLQPVETSHVLDPDAVLDDLLKQAAPIPVPKVDAAAAAADLKAAVKDAARKAIASQALIPAPIPDPLHTIQFPVYDRKASGYRIIERAVGTPELKVLVKVVLDALLTGDPAAVVEPALALDASQHVVSQADLLHIERRSARWKCRHQENVHDTRGLFRANGTIDRDVEIGLFNRMDSCINDHHYNRDRNIESVDPANKGRFAPSGFDRYVRDSIHTTPDAWAFYEDHAPFMQYRTHDGYWTVSMPDVWNPRVTLRDPSKVTWSFEHGYTTPNNSF